MSCSIFGSRNIAANPSPRRGSGDNKNTNGAKVGRRFSVGAGEFDLPLSAMSDEVGS